MKGAEALLEVAPLFFFIEKIKKKYKRFALIAVRIFFYFFVFRLGNSTLRLRYKNPKGGGQYCGGGEELLHPLPRLQLRLRFRFSFAFFCKHPPLIEGIK